MPAGLPIFHAERGRAAKGPRDADLCRADGETRRQFGELAAPERSHGQARKGASRVRRDPEAELGALAPNHPGEFPTLDDRRKKETRTRTGARFINASLKANQDGEKRRHHHLLLSDGTRSIGAHENARVVRRPRWIDSDPPSAPSGLLRCPRTRLFIAGHQK